MPLKKILKKAKKKLKDDGIKISIGLPGLHGEHLVIKHNYKKKDKSNDDDVLNINALQAEPGSPKDNDNSKKQVGYGSFNNLLVDQYKNEMKEETSQKDKKQQIENLLLGTHKFRVKLLSYDIEDFKQFNNDKFFRKHGINHIGLAFYVPKLNQGFAIHWNIDQPELPQIIFLNNKEAVKHPIYKGSKPLAQIKLVPKYKKSGRGIIKIAKNLTGFKGEKYNFFKRNCMHYTDKLLEKIGMGKELANKDKIKYYYKNNPGKQQSRLLDTMIGLKDPLKSKKPRLAPIVLKLVNDKEKESSVKSNELMIAQDDVYYSEDELQQIDNNKKKQIIDDEQFARQLQEEDAQQIKDDAALARSLSKQWNGF